MIWRTIVLTFRLMIDRRVSVWHKLVPILSVIYFLSPLDFIPDFIPVVGIVDDIGLLILGLNFFLKLAPDAVLHEHIEAISKHDKVLRELPPLPMQKGKRKNEDITEGRIIE